MVSMTSLNAVFGIQQACFWISTLFYISEYIFHGHGISLDRNTHRNAYISSQSITRYNVRFTFEKLGYTFTQKIHCVDHEKVMWQHMFIRIFISLTACYISQRLVKPLWPKYARPKCCNRCCETRILSLFYALQLHT